MQNYCYFFNWIFFLAHNQLTALTCLLCQQVIERQRTPAEVSDPSDAERFKLLLAVISNSFSSFLDPRRI